MTSVLLRGEIDAQGDTKGLGAQGKEHVKTQKEGSFLQANERPQKKPKLPIP